MRPERTIAKLSAREPLTIVALGDSLTYGWQVGRGYLDFLAEMLLAAHPGTALRILNRGVPGDTAAGGLRRVGVDVLPHAPDCVLVQFALNDAFSGVTSTAFDRSVRELIAAIRTSTRTEVVLVTSVWFDDPAFYPLVESSFYRRLEAAADDCGLAVARVHERWKARVLEGMVELADLVQSDGVHPTEQGYRLMAEAVMSVFEDTGD
jgi:acyl-CoA thioesterase-1